MQIDENPIENAIYDSVGGITSSNATNDACNEQMVSEI